MPPGGNLGAVVEVELAEDVADVERHSAGSDGHLLRNLAVSQARRHQVSNPLFGWGEVGFVGSTPASFAIAAPVHWHRTGLSCRGLLALLARAGARDIC
jgi:hypothetical protein